MCWFMWNLCQSSERSFTRIMWELCILPADTLLQTGSAQMLQRNCTLVQALHMRCLGRERRHLSVKVWKAWVERIKCNTSKTKFHPVRISSLVSRAMQGTNEEEIQTKTSNPNAPQLFWFMYRLCVHFHHKERNYTLDVNISQVVVKISSWHPPPPTL